jgi:hypothetical protein
VFRFENSQKFNSINKLLGQDFLFISRDYFDMIKNNVIDKHLFNESEKKNVTVILGVRDRLDYRLENAFESIRNQDYDQALIDIILVDYGSKNKFVSGFKKLCKKYNVKYIRKCSDKWSRSHALNIGIKNVKTKFILCSDVDIIFEKNYVRECINRLIENPFQVLWNTMLDLPEGRLSCGDKIGKSYEELKNSAIPRAQIQNLKYPYGNSIIFTLTRFFYDIRGYDENYTVWGSEDKDINERFKMMGLKIKNIGNKSSFLHQWHESYEGLSEEERGQIKKNSNYFYQAYTLLRNETGWGLV